MSTLTLSPAGLRLEVAEGAALQDVLFEHGVDFPCGGHGRCQGCRVKLLQGRLEPTDEEARLFTAAEIAEGWRLACRHAVTGDLALELAQWDMPVLGDASVFAFTPREGLGVAVDLGTTTIAAQLLDLETSRGLAGETALNAQARHGADILSRVDFALRGGQDALTRLIREQVGAMAGRLMAAAPKDKPLRRILLAGNTVMHHLFCGLDATPLATHPFEPVHKERMRFAPADLGWAFGEAAVEFLPCIGGLVGADILAGIKATGLHESERLEALIDLGTNGEVVLGNRERLVCTSTAAGPAFEGARITMGMRAATGAISEVTIRDGGLACRVIGGGAARGVCGSGLVDAAAAALELGWIEPGGRMTVAALPLCGSVSLEPWDIRELQLAKGAIAAGLRLLAARLGASPGDIGRLHLAGAFGNYINRTSAARIGLLRLPLERVVPAGNTALLGTKRALFEEVDGWDALAGRIEHVALNEEPEFQSVFAEEMRFPG